MKAGKSDRHVLAQGAICDILPIAPAAGLPEVNPMSIAACIATLDVTKGFPCDTFPSNWPSPLRVGSFFSRRLDAENSSHRARDSVELYSITTNDRGISCGKSSCLAFWPCRLQLVWKMTCSAAYWARALARRLHPLRAAISTRAQFWAACSAQSATMFGFAARDTNIISAFGPAVQLGSNGLPARLALFAIAQRILPRALARPWPYQELAHV
jgi:hypothetical protein